MVSFSQRVEVLFGRFFIFPPLENEEESGETLLRFFFFASSSSLFRQAVVTNHLLLLPSSSFAPLPLNKMSNPIVFFDITADGAPLGRIEMTVSRLLLEREKRVDLLRR